jgi:hypothetical protein
MTEAERGSEKNALAFQTNDNIVVVTSCKAIRRRRHQIDEQLTQNIFKHLAPD